ncbi:MAG: hypothetical protein JO032_05215 [Alphaproteobacteria bacterium]|nr:hypothetical protein [Alphaproteobacteria bacterium]
MNLPNRISRNAGLAGMLGLAALVAATAPGVAASPDQAPPLAPGAARVWFLRQLLPGTQFHPPMIFVNSAPIGSSAEGTVFYRDFAPGQYAFTVENCLPQPGSGQTMNLQPNTQYALEVTSDENGAWDCSPPQFSYLRQIQPQAVPYKFAQVNYIGAR